METEKTYNGWSNYESWNVALWIDNEEPMYREATRAARKFTREADDIDEARGDMSRWLKEFVTDQAPDLGASMFSDLLGAALSEVDWFEIAEHYICDSDWKDEHPDETADTGA